MTDEIMPINASEYLTLVEKLAELSDAKKALALKLQAVTEYAEYRKDNSPCCRDILKLLTGDKAP